MLLLLLLLLLGCGKRRLWRSWLHHWPLLLLLLLLKLLLLLELQLLQMLECLCVGSALRSLLRLASLLGLQLGLVQ